jgi:NDP-sugar pyrophosphorylase family protein
LHIPIIKNKKLVEIIFYNQVVKFLEKRIKNNQKIIFILIMAGGYGKRMRPISKIIPKPLLQNNQGEPILVNTIKKFHSLNKNSNIYVSLFYKNAIIKKILKKNINFKLNYINERVPLGTIGCLKEMQNKIQDNIMVINCDTLINFNPNIVYDFHLKSNNDLTIVSSVEKFRLDYGILFFNKNNRVKNFLEKPENEYNLNVGLYIFKKKVIKLIGNEEKLDFPQLLRRCLKKKLNVKLFPVQSFMWNDIGNPKNYRSYLKNN